MSPTVAIVDIGSNSIKVLVATRTPAGGVSPLLMRTLDVRISTGISEANPRLSADGMTRGLEAIQTLLADAAKLSPTQTVMVATSAVRDASNGPQFREQVRAATGHSIRILTGDEEANLIGAGLCCDPALAALADFYVFDLGGGSLECLAFRQRKIRQAVSLQLGCVRLTEKFVADPAAPISPAQVGQIAVHTKAVLAGAGFKFDLPPGAVAVGTGGTVTTVRTILGAREGKPFSATSADVSVDSLRLLLGATGALTLEQRRTVPGLPPARADVFPTALATFIAIAEAGAFITFRNSVYNLRYGLAREALGSAD
jgi:exopolyphosphatase/guanosine-5'-triphosphate,3'-diphosphate pyrophosphatase